MTFLLKLVGYVIINKLTNLNKNNITNLDIYLYLSNNEMLFNEVSMAPFE